MDVITYTCWDLSDSKLQYIPRNMQTVYIDRPNSCKATPNNIGKMYESTQNLYIILTDQSRTKSYATVCYLWTHTMFINFNSLQSSDSA